MTALTREQVTKWALDCDIIDNRDLGECFIDPIVDDLQRFAAIAYAEGQVAQAKRQPPPPMVVDNPDVVALVAAAVRTEREACARMLDQMAEEAEQDCEPSSLVAYYREKAAAIRARGTA